MTTIHTTGLKSHRQVAYCQGLKRPGWRQRLTEGISARRLPRAFRLAGALICMTIMLCAFVAVALRLGFSESLCFMFFALSRLRVESFAFVGAPPPKRGAAAHSWVYL
jgi:hypothetical protein